MLQYQTVTPTLLRVLKIWIEYEELSDFRLVGGTALALQYGHRQSVDIDLFTPNELPETLNMLLAKQKNLNLIKNGKYHIAVSHEEVKIDFTYWSMDFEEYDAIDGIRMASPIDIFAMKLDAITSRRTRKDYYDLAELVYHFGFRTGFERYNKHYPYAKNSQIIFEAIGGIEDAEPSEEPVLLKNQNWDDVKHFLRLEAKNFFLKSL